MRIQLIKTHSITRKTISFVPIAIDLIRKPCHILSPDLTVYLINISFVQNLHINAK